MNNASVFLSPDYLKSDAGKKVTDALWGGKTPQEVLDNGTNLTPEWARTLGLNLNASGQLLPDNSGATDARNNAGMFGMSTQQLTEQTVAGNYTGGISTSFDPYYQQQKNLEKMMDIQRGRIQSQFNQASTEEQERAKLELGTAKAQTARFGGGDMGLDTASAGYIQSVQKASDARMKQLQDAREQAMATADETYLTAVNTAIKNEVDRRDKLAEQQWNRAMDLLGVKTQQDTLAFNKEKYADELVQEQQTFDENVRQFDQNYALNVLKTQITQSSDEVDQQVKFQQLLNETPYGQKVTIGDLVGTGRKSSTGINYNVTVGAMLGLDKSLAAKFDTDMEQEYNNVNAGNYGTNGAREVALKNLQTKYPGIANKIADVIYGSDQFNAVFPDGYESNIKQKATDLQFAQESINTIAQTLISSSNGDKEKAKKAIGMKRITVNEKELTLNDDTYNALIKAIDSQ